MALPCGLTDFPGQAKVAKNCPTFICIRSEMNHLQRYLTDEFTEDFQEGRITRRDALKLIASVTGSLIVANSILAACAAPPEETQAVISPTEAMTATDLAPVEQPTATQAPISSAPAEYGTVMPNDAAVIASEIEIPSDIPPLMGYLSRPASVESAPIVLVCHENRGLTAHIQDVTRRFAKAGYVSLAVDLVSRQGGSAAVGESGVPGALGNIDPDQFVADFLAGWRYLQGQPFAQADRVGMTGFCFGGGVTWLMAAHMPELRAAVPFYGPPRLWRKYRTFKRLCWLFTADWMAASLARSHPLSRPCLTITKCIKS